MAAWVYLGRKTHIVAFGKAIGHKPVEMGALTPEQESKLRACGCEPAVEMPPVLAEQIAREITELVESESKPVPPLHEELAQMTPEPDVYVVAPISRRRRRKVY